MIKYINDVIRTDKPVWTWIDDAPKSIIVIQKLPYTGFRYINSDCYFEARYHKSGAFLDWEAFNHLGEKVKIQECHQTSEFGFADGKQELIQEKIKALNHKISETTKEIKELENTIRELNEMKLAEFFSE